MSNSSLVNYTRISPNSNNPRNKPITKITIHHMAGNLSVETCGNIFAGSGRQTSSNYGIGTDGRVGMYVEEKNRSWCSSSGENDHQAITIEVANDQIGGEWHVGDKAMAKLIDLCVDICQRNNIAKLNYTGDKSGNLTMHCWFAATACPGPYLKGKFPYIASEVNKRLSASESAPPVEDNTSTEDKLYRVQMGAFAKKENADALLKKVKVAGFDAFVTKVGELYKVQAGAYKKKGNAENQAAKVRAAGFEAIIATSTAAPAAEAPAASTDPEKTIWDFLKGKGLNDCAVAGIMGNLYAESALKPTNLQNSYEKKLGMSDDGYTAAVDNGSYTNFAKDSAGYGLAQWTFWSRKQALLEYAQSVKKSIGDLAMQLEFLWKEMQGYSGVMSVLKSAASVRQASDVILTQYEKPADQSEAVQVKRAGYGQKYYDKFASGSTTTAPTPSTGEFQKYLARVNTTILRVRKEPTTDSEIVQSVRSGEVYTIVAETTGKGATKWGKLKSGVGWIALDYTVKIKEVA